MVCLSSVLQCFEQAGLTLIKPVCNEVSHLSRAYYIQVGGRRGLSHDHYDSIHLIIVHGSHQLTKLISNQNMLASFMEMLQPLRLHFPSVPYNWRMQVYSKRR